MAKLLRVVREGTDHAHLEIDGEPFPFFTVDGFTVHPERGKPPCVSVTIAADCVEVLDSGGTGTD
jgi:hypothetical protein